MRKFISGFTLALAIIQLLVAALMAGGSTLAFRNLITAFFFRADCLLAVAAQALFLLTRLGKDWASCFAAATILTASTALSHAGIPVRRAAAAALLTAGHHLGPAAWIGGLASLLVAIPPDE